MSPDGFGGDCLFRCDVRQVCVPLLTCTCLIDGKLMVDDTCCLSVSLCQWQKLDLMDSDWRRQSIPELRTPRLDAHHSWDRRTLCVLLSVDGRSGTSKAIKKSVFQWAWWLIISSILSLQHHSCYISVNSHPLCQKTRGGGHTLTDANHTAVSPPILQGSTLYQRGDQRSMCCPVAPLLNLFHSTMCVRWLSPSPPDNVPHHLYAKKCVFTFSTYHPPSVSSSLAQGGDVSRRVVWTATDSPPTSATTRLGAEFRQGGLVSRRSGMSQREWVASCYWSCLSRERQHSDLLWAHAVCLTFVSEVLPHRCKTNIHALVYRHL